MPGLTLGLGLGMSRAGGNFKIFADHQALIDWHESTGVAAPLENLARQNYRVNVEAEKQRIRDGAGNQVTPGIESGQVVGLSNEGAVGSPRGLLNITQLSSITAVASSGSGTSSDPYIIQNLDCFGDTGRALQCNDTDGTAYVEFRNCIFRSGTNAECILTGLGVLCTFRNCLFYDAVNAGATTYGIQFSGGSWAFYNCHFAGGNHSHALGNTNAATSLYLKNCRFDETQGNLGSAGHVVSAATAAWTSLELENCEFTGSANMLRCLQMQNGCVYLRCENTLFQGVFMSALSYSGTASATVDIGTFIFNNNKVVDCDRECIRFNRVGSATVRYNEFIHENNGAGYRPFNAEYDSAAQGDHWADLTFEYNYIVKTDGSNQAGDEAFEVVFPGNFRIRYNWIDGTTEDGIEIVAVPDGPFETREIAYNVIDSCGNQGIDIFLMADYDNWVQYEGNNNLSGVGLLNLYIHHNYGDTSDYGIILSAVRGVFGHDNYIGNTLSVGSHAILRIEEREYPVGETPAVYMQPRDCFFAGPFALSDDRVGEVADIFGTTYDCEVQFFDDAAGTGDLTVVTS